MSKKRMLPCRKKEVFAIGAENSLADCKTQLQACFDCHSFIECKESQKILDMIKRQQNLYLVDKWRNEKTS